MGNTEKDNSKIKIMVSYSHKDQQYANMVVSVDNSEELSLPENIIIPDSKNVSKDLYTDGAFRFAVFGNTKEYKTMFDQFVANRSIYKMKEVSDFQVFLGADINTEAVKKATENSVLAKNYNYFEKENSSFITLPNVSGNIYSYDATLWTWFKDRVDKSLENVFIFLDRNYITNHKAEMQAFKNIVETAADKGKNIYVFGGGFVNKYTVENKVRYINTAGVFPSISLNGTSVSYIEYVLVTVNGNDVSYEYKPVFGE